MSKTIKKTVGAFSAAGLIICSSAAVCFKVKANTDKYSEYSEYKDFDLFRDDSNWLYNNTLSIQYYPSPSFTEFLKCVPIGMQRWL
ncbi:MAG: hypothetical protein HUJ54_12635 [Erysipelotrichaceae bacterium]|nr:hypothetical protein [Erysipelotrichaceae bacterium]